METKGQRRHRYIDVFVMHLSIMKLIPSQGTSVSWDVPCLIDTHSSVSLRRNENVQRYYIKGDW